MIKNNILIECLSTLQNVDSIIRQVTQPTIRLDSTPEKLKFELPDDIKKLAAVRGTALSYNFLLDAKSFQVGELGEISIVSKYQKQIIH